MEAVVSAHWNGVSTLAQVWAILTVGLVIELICTELGI